MATDLRFTTAGRAAIADGANRGLNQLTFTKISIGSGYGPGGAADDGRAALRHERHSGALEGTAAVAGEVLLCAEIRTNAAYDVREIGLWGRKGAAGPETLYAYWTDPSAANKFAAAVVDGTILVAGSLVVNPEGAALNVAVTARVTLESQGLLPLWLLPMPHVETAAHQLGVVAAAAAAGGTVTVAANQKLSLGKASANGSSAFSKGVKTAAWGSGDLDANSTYYLRAQLNAAGALVLYVQKGADGDATPASLKGTPNVAQGGGFQSTVLDARLAKIVTAAAASVPAMTRYALEATPRPGVAAWAGTEDYAHPAAAWGSDAELYVTVRSSGPSHGGSVDPTGDADYSHWRPALLSKALPEQAPAKDDLLRYADRDAAAPGGDKVSEVRKIFANLDHGTPAGTDKLAFRDESGDGDPLVLVEIRKLPAALEPAGGTALNARYALKKIADKTYELALVASVSMVVTAALNIIYGGDNQPTFRQWSDWKQFGQALAIPAGRYDLTAMALIDQAYGDRHFEPVGTGSEARIEHQAGGAWGAVPGTANNSFLFGSYGRYRAITIQGSNVALAAGSIRLAVRAKEPSRAWASASRGVLAASAKG